jgi:hypothetical protein
MTMLTSFTAVVTSVANGSIVKLNTTPFRGGNGRKAILRCPVLPLTSTVLIQGHPVTADGLPPDAGSSGWTTVATFTSAAAHNQEVALPDYARWRTSVLDDDGPNVVVYLEGVQ